MIPVGFCSKNDEGYTADSSPPTTKSFPDGGDCYDRMD